ncbi:hypothetical protein ACFQ0B_32325 [Nonomuraea thailandensis]
MSPRRHSVTVTEPVGTDPLWCEEYGYGLGRVEGILVLKYRSAAVLEFGESRQDFLHQLYWSPDGMLSTRYGARTQFVGHREAFWAHRAVTHEVRAADRQTVYRICLRETPRRSPGCGPARCRWARRRPGSSRPSPGRPATRRRPSPPGRESWPGSARPPPTSSATTLTGPGSR